MISLKRIPQLLQPPRLRLKLPFTDTALELWQWLLALAVGLLVTQLSNQMVIIILIGLPIAFIVVEKPLYGLIAALFLGPLGAWEKIFVGGPIAAVTSGQIVLLLTIGLWLARSLRRGRLYIPRTPFNLPIIIFLGVTSLSLWWAEDVMGGVRELLKWIESLLIIWMILDLTAEYRPKQVVRGLIVALMAAGLVQAIWGVWQFALRGTGPDHFSIFPGFYRATGSFQQPNPFGGYMAMMSCLAVGVLVGLFREKLKNEKITVAALVDTLRSSTTIKLATITTFIIFWALIGSWSRGSWINFAFGMAIFAIFMPAKRSTGVAIIAGSGVLFWVILQLGVLPQAFSDRLLGFLGDFSLSTLDNISSIGINANNFAILERLAHWKAALNMANEQLWTGVGFGNYEVVYNDYSIDFFKEPLGHAHNYYLNMLAESGVGGLFVYIGMWVAIFYQTIRAADSADWLERGTALGLLAMWSGMAVHHMLDNLYVNNMYIQLGVMFTLVIMLQLSASEEKREKTRTEQ